MASQSTVDYKPFIELHSGPGEGYPVFHVIPNGDKIEMIALRSSWFKVRGPDNTIGWIKADNLFDAIYDPKDVHRHVNAFYDSRKYETSISFGRFGSDALVNISAGYRFNDMFSGRLSLGKTTGDYYSNWMMLGEVVTRFLASSALSPLLVVDFGFGFGQARSTYVGAPNSNMTLLGYGAGAEWSFAKNLKWHAVLKQQITSSTSGVSGNYVEWQTGMTAVF